MFVAALLFFLAALVVGIASIASTAEISIDPSEIIFSAALAFVAMTVFFVLPFGRPPRI